MASMNTFAPCEAPAREAAGEIIAGWQHIFGLLANKPRRKPADEQRPREEAAEREPPPFVAMSPFGGYYFGPR